MAISAEVLREVWRITERRGNAVYRTEYVEDRWIPLGADKGTRPDNDHDLQWAVKSTGYDGPTIRSVVTNESEA